MDNINLEKIIKADELDQNMILNVPEEIGIQIQKIIQGEEDKGNPVHIEILQSLNDKMTLAESRKLVFKINDILFPITIMDMPCIIEGCKTMDNKTYYKSGDINQMLYVHDKNISATEDIQNFEPFKTDDTIFNNMIWKNDPDHIYKSRHGLTLPTKNIKQKRFKIKKRYNKEEVAVVCKKLKHIIDNGAANFEKNFTEEGELIANTDNKSSRNGISLAQGKDNASIMEQSMIISEMEGSEVGGESRMNKIVIPNLSSKTPNASNVKNNKKQERAKETNNKIQFDFNLNTNDNNKTIYTLNTESSNNNLALKESPMNTNTITINTKPINSEDELKKIQLKDEFTNLKNQYASIRKQLEIDPNDKDKNKLKKYLKKKMKHIKEQFKILNNDEDDKKGDDDSD